MNVGAGWEVLLLEDGELLVSRRCTFESEARYIADVFKQDTMRAGWVGDTRNLTNGEAT
jgi:hypothetical protein